MKRFCRAGVLLAFSWLAAGCSSEEQVVAEEYRPVPPSKVRLEQICRSYEKGDYRNFITLIHNYKDKPAFYQSQLVAMFKQRAVERKERDQVISKMEPGEVVLLASHTAADLYIDVSYANGQKEEIIVPMIYDGGKWWIK